MDYRAWYEKVYPDLYHAGLWLRGGEINSLPLSEYEARRFRALFVRLSTYFDTSSSFTHQILYQMAARTPDVFPDLAYLPPRQDLTLFARDNVPWLLGTQSKLGPSGFDLIGFSNSIVQELINLPAFLEKSGIPLAKSERMARADVPLIILGGANALYSSAVWMLHAPGSVQPARSLVDGVFVGESDIGFRRILETCRDGKASGHSKARILEDLERIPGFIQPDRPRPTRKGFIPNLDQSEALETGLVSYVDDQLGSAHLQISEGCPAFCSFCAESWERKPYRERSAASVRETALRAKAAMGLDGVDLYSFNFNTHSGFYQLLWELVEPFRSVGLKSQRFDLLAHDPRMLEFQHAVEKASLTCGLEGVSPRLRAYLRKNLQDDEIHSSIAAVFKSKARELKIFLIATGLEEDEDFKALAELLDRIRLLRQSASAGTRLIFSMTPLVRFPWTPLEFEDAPPLERYVPIIAKAAARVRAAGFEFRESAELAEYWVSQILVRPLDPRVGEALLDAVGTSGFVYYREISDGFRAELERALRKRGLDPAKLLEGSEFEDSVLRPWAFPWVFIDTGVRREFLWDELRRAREFTELDYCLGRSWRKARCSHCGGCPTRFHVRDIVLARQKRDYTLEQLKDRSARLRKSETRVRLRVNVGQPARGLPRKMMGVAVARALMLAHPRLVPYYRGYAGAWWDGDGREVWITGEDVLALVFRREALTLMEEVIGDSLALDAANARLGEWGQVVGLAQDDWRPQLVTTHSPFALKADRFLKARGLKHTLFKQPDGSYRYALTAQSAKKGILSEIVERREDDGSVVCSVRVGPKFNPHEFALEAFALPKSVDWVRVRMVSR